MNLACQQDCLEKLMQYVESDRHSILIEGGPGVGKSYCVTQLAEMLKVDDIMTIEPTVNAVRSAIDSCYSIEHKLLICIDNLDQGVKAASYAMLKFLEEPKHNVYIAVTCTNLYDLPDTIISRSVVASISYPTPDDILLFAQYKNADKYMQLCTSTYHHPVWGAVKTFAQIITVFDMSIEQLNYFQTLSDNIRSKRLLKDSVSSILWTLGHYPDNTEIDPQLMLQFIMTQNLDQYMQKTCISCLQELNKRRIAAHVIVAKFIMEWKYGG